MFMLGLVNIVKVGATAPAKAASSPLGALATATVLVVVGVWAYFVVIPPVVAAAVAVWAFVTWLVKVVLYTLACLVVVALWAAGMFGGLLLGLRLNQLDAQREVRIEEYLARQLPVTRVHGAIPIEPVRVPASRCDGVPEHQLSS